VIGSASRPGRTSAHEDRRAVIGLTRTPAGRHDGPPPRPTPARAVFAATVTRASVRLPPAAILLSARQQVGTYVTGPNSSS